MKEDLLKLKKEISLYKNENALWTLDKEIANCGGNLCLHLVGNLNSYIGGVYGNTGYVRQRDLEFTMKNVPREELIQKVDETLVNVKKGLDNISTSQLREEYPLLVFREKTTVEYFLIHLSAHLAYHLGQLNYHRRLLDD